MLPEIAAATGRHQPHLRIVSCATNGFRWTAPARQSNKMPIVGRLLHSNVAEIDGDKGAEPLRVRKVRPLLPAHAGLNRRCIPPVQRSLLRAPPPA
jgi:hypothetical protein